MKILIAEDDKDLRLLLESVLGRSGYSVECVPNGEEAFKKASAEPPDIIISDIMMPEMDGFMLCRKVKEDSRLKNIPVMLYTATQSGKDEQELAAKLGAAKLLVKTEGLEPLLEGIKAELGNIQSAGAAGAGAVQAGSGVDAEYIRVLTRKLHEKDLEVRKERDLAQMYLDIAGVMMVALDASGTITLINKKGSDILGYGEGELLGKNWFETCLPADAVAGVKDVFGKIIAGDLAPVEYYENPVLTKSGKKCVISFHNSIIRDGSGAITGVLFSGMDMTEQRNAEAVLFQAQKMDSIGQLSAGIAHDLNNLLGPVMAYADFLRKTMPAGDARLGDIDEITRAASRAAMLVRQLLAFSRRQVLEPQVLDLNSVVRGLDGMLRRIIGENVRIAYSFDTSAGLVKVDPSQMEQVVINLAMNARDAMARGGTIAITTGTTDLKAAGERPAGRFFELAVRDTGCGMDAAVLGRIFEPFFTTKGNGHGNGLGLSSVYGIVKQSGGEVKVESCPGEGSVFRVFLPLVSGVQPLPAAAEAVKKGAVLLAEDDETMRRISKRILSSAGYKVIEAVDGREALMLLEQDPAAVSVLLTDVVMPELDGIGLAREVLGRYPDIRIVCMSGYADKREELGEVLGGKVGYIQKPFAPDDLLKKIEEMPGKA